MLKKEPFLLILESTNKHWHFLYAEQTWIGISGAERKK